MGSGQVTIYRALIAGCEIGAGDWVTPVEDYALNHERYSLRDEQSVVDSIEVNGDEVFSHSADPNEYIYVPSDTFPSHIECLDDLWNHLGQDEKPSHYPDIERIAAAQADSEISDVSVDDVFGKLKAEENKLSPSPKTRAIECAPVLPSQYVNGIPLLDEPRFRLLGDALHPARCMRYALLISEGASASGSFAGIAASAIRNSSKIIAHIASVVSAASRMFDDSPSPSKTTVFFRYVSPDPT
jgi:hypothetical protein